MSDPAGLFVPELQKPGRAIAGVSSEAAYGFERYVDLIVAQLDDAAVALTMFERTPASAWMHDPSSPAYAKRREELVMQTLHTAPPSSANEFLRVRFEAEVQAKHELWADGVAPEHWGSALHRIYARAFVYALDMMAKALDKLVKEPGSPPEVKSVLEALLERIPGLKKARDSLHHLEERALGRAWGKPIEPQPVTTGSIRTAGGLFIIENLDGSRFGITADSGEFVEVDVCRATLAAAQEAVQGTINAFTWTGHPEHLP